MTRARRRSGGLALLLCTGSVLLGSMSDAPAATDPPAAPVEEVIEVPGAANPLDAPLVPPGSVVDTILQSETLWYAVAAQPGQQVQATVLLLGRPDGPASEDTLLTATLTDPQRQPLQSSEGRFDGRRDARVDLAAQVIPATGGDRPLLSIALASTANPESLRGTGYRVQLTLSIEGTPLPTPADADAPGSTVGTPTSDPVVTTAPVAPPAGPDLVRDLAPFALIALAVGGAAGFELSRRGL